MMKMKCNALVILSSFILSSCSGFKYRNPASQGSVSGITASDFILTDDVRKKIKMAEDILGERGTYFIDERGREVGILSLIEEGSGTIRAVTTLGNGQSYGLMVKKGKVDLDGKTLGISMAAYDAQFKTLYSARSMTLDLTQRPVEIHSKFSEMAQILEQELRAKFSTSLFSNPFKSILNLIIPTAHAGSGGKTFVLVIGILNISIGILNLSLSVRSKNPAYSTLSGAVGGFCLSTGVLGLIRLGRSE